MSNLARHKEYYLRGWRSNIRAEIELDSGVERTAAAQDENADVDHGATFKSLAPAAMDNKKLAAAPSSSSLSLSSPDRFFSLGYRRPPGYGAAAAATAAAAKTYYYYGEKPGDVSTSTVSSDIARRGGSGGSKANGLRKSRSRDGRHGYDEAKSKWSLAAATTTVAESDRFYVAPSRIHRRGVSGAAAADFHHRNLNGFSSASASDSRSQLSASSPDSLDAASHNQSGDVDSGQNNNSGRSSGNYYYRKLQSNESPSRRRVVRHRARRNVPSPLASSSNGNENGGVVNGSVRSNTGSHASHLSKSSPSLDHAGAATATATAAGRSSSMSNNTDVSGKAHRQRGSNGYESFGSRNGSPFRHHQHHDRSGGLAFKGVRSVSTEGRMDSGHISLDPRLHGQSVDAAPPPAAVPNPDYSPVMVRHRYYQDRIMLDKDASNFKYEDDKIKVRKNQIRLKSTTLQPPPPPNLWGNAQRYKGSLENMLEAEQEEQQQQQSGRSRAGMMVKDFLSRNSRRRRRGRMFSLPSRRKSNNDDSENSRMSSGRSSEDRDDDEVENAAAMAAASMTSLIYQDLLSAMRDDVSTNGSGRGGGGGNGGTQGRYRHHHPHDQQQPISLQGSRMGSYGRIDGSRKSALQNEIRSKQSHFFNSLFPSRANRFGYPVYPERELGIPSRAGPVSFAGFSPSIASSVASGATTTANGRGGQADSLLSQATVDGNGSRRRRRGGSKGSLMNSLLKLF